MQNKPKVIIIGTGASGSSAAWNLSKSSFNVICFEQGPELKKNGEGLLTWILKNKRGSIDGYTNSIWSGLTTIELSRAIIYCIKNNLNGLLHIYSSPIAKYDLIKIINDRFNLDIQINKVSGKNSNKSLTSIRNDFNHKIPSHLEMISEMHEFIKNYK